jgi:hypothetical protein
VNRESIMNTLSTSSDVIKAGVNVFVTCMLGQHMANSWLLLNS